MLFLHFPFSFAVTSLPLNRYFEAQWLVNFPFSIPKFLSPLLRHRLENFLDLTLARLQALTHRNHARSPVIGLRKTPVGRGGVGW